MFETMYQAEGVGLAAPQIGLPIRLFIVDAESMDEDDDELDLDLLERIALSVHVLGSYPIAT